MCDSEEKKKVMCVFIHVLLFLCDHLAFRMLELFYLGVNCFYRLKAELFSGSLTGDAHTVNDLCVIW